MHSIPPDTEAQIWQRVAAPPDAQADASPLLGLIHAGLVQAARYQALSAVLSGSGRVRCRQLWEAQLSTVAALRGILVLTGSAQPRLAIPAAAVRSIQSTLTLCYHQARAASGEYAARSISPEYGPVFRTLSQREEAHCTVLAGLLGG